MHLKGCQREEQKYEMPEPHSFLQFKEYQKCVPLPFVIYCDFEALNLPVHVHSSQRILTKTKHVPASFLCHEGIHPCTILYVSLPV